MVLNVYRNHKAYREKEGKGVWRFGEREIIYLSLHCHCIVKLFVLITIMLGFSFIQYTNTWLSHKAFFITRDIDI